MKCNEKEIMELAYSMIEDEDEIHEAYENGGVTEVGFLIIAHIIDNSQNE